MIALALLAWATATSASGYSWDLPRGISPPHVPADNPMSAAKVTLGRQLFYDADLSIDGTISCATCHEQQHAFTDGNTTHPGVGGRPGLRNVMGLANVAYFHPLTWADPDLRSLESQAVMPMTNRHPIEMGDHGQLERIVDRLRRDPCYRQMFAVAFPDEPISATNIARAIASFERTLLSFNSPYDRYLRGDTKAISPLAKTGAQLFFGKAGCSACHSGINFTDLAYHDVGTGDRDDEGVEMTTHRAVDKGQFRTPSLRNVALTSPYLHSGKAKTLATAIIDHFRGGFGSVSLVHPPALSHSEVVRLVAFLKSLSDHSFITNPAFSLPRTACGKPF